MNRIHPYKGSTQSTGIMTLPGGRPVQRLQFGGRPVQRFQSGGSPWQTAFNYVRNLLGESVEAIAKSVVTVGLPALIMGVSPRDALKLSAASGIASLGAQKFNKLRGTGTGGTGTTGTGTSTAAVTVAPEEKAKLIEQMRAAGVVPEGPLEYDPNTVSSETYSPKQLQDFKSALTPITASAGDIDRRGLFESLGDVVTEEDKWGSLKQAFLPDTRAFQDKKDYIRQYGPMLGLGIGALWASGQFDPPKPLPKPDPWGGQTSRGLMEANPAAYRSAPTFVPRGQHGGIIQSFPRRNGSIRGPGTGTSDEIPAMLSDGEFVMTADAVRGAGNGSRKHGMRRMYDMMQNFEGAS